MAFTAEDLFNSIDTIVGQRLSALSFDTTVIATIVDDSKKAQGHYVVSDGNIKFDAYTNDTNYKVDDQVRVTVLNGDWSQKKFIAGKYVDDKANMEPIHYTSPLGTTMGVGSTPLGTRSYWDLTTNDRSLMQTDPVTIHIDADDTTLQVEGIYNVITLSTEVKTNMGAIGSVASGNYGILVEFVMQPAQGTTVKRFFTFDSSEMVGNPYAFVLDTHQEKKIVVPTIGHVIAINISAYQGLTYDDKGFAHPAPFVDKSGAEIGPHDITFSQTTIGFGSDLTMVEDNSLKLYTLDSATYQWNNGDGKNNTKRLSFVWYNKDDNDEYVGYSDGICDPDYDEIDYLKTKTLDSRLVAQQGKEVPNDEESLRLAANAAEAEPLMRKAYQALTTSVSQVLQRLDSQLVGATEIQEELAKLISGYTESQTFYEAKLSAAFTNAKNATDELVAFYKGVLKYGYHMSTQTIAEDGSDVWKSEWNDADPYTTFLNVFVTIKKDIADFFIFMEEKTAKSEVLSGYRPFYNDYKPKINTQLAIIDSYLDQIPITSEDTILLHSYENKTEYKKYDQGEEYWKQFANRYCVYWYRYNPHYLSTHTVPISEDEWEALATKPTSHDTYEAYESYIEQQNIEHKYGDFLGSYWERIRQNGTQVLQNYGVPHDTDGDGVPDIAKGEDLPASSDDPIILERTLDPTTDSESYQIVMFYNHEMIKSNVVTFTNTEAHLIPPESKTDGGDKLLIEHDVDSRDHYQVYSSAYDLLNIRDGSLYRQIKCTYDGVLAGNEAMADAEIYWYVPVNSTMITYDLAFLKNKGFNTDAELEAPTSYSKNGYIYFNRKIGYTEKMEDLLDSDGNPIYKDDGTKQQKSVVEITDADRYFFYKIKNFYEPSAQNNTILVDVYVSNKVEPTKGELTLTFGTFGTNGTKYTLAVVPAGTQTSLQPNGEGDDAVAGDLELKITLYNADGEALDLNTNYDGEFYSLSKEWYAKSAAAPDLGELTQIVTAESDPDAAEQQTPQSSKSWLLSVPGATGMNYDDNRYIGLVKVSTVFEGGPENNPNEIELSTLYAVPYSSSEDLYMSGPTTIVYNSQGTISRMSEEPYKLYQHKLVNRYLVNHERDNDIYAAFKASDEDNYEEYLRIQYPDATIELSYVDSYDEEVAGQKWQLLYYQSDGNIATDPENVTRSYLDYMPLLNSDNTLRPALMYYDYKGATDEEHIFFVPVAQCLDENDNILWTQPIIVIQNKYESAMLNAWDGSLQIDEANGTIMSTMMGAGIKNRDNTFSGVLMGDIVAGADFDTRNANGIGLYGFHEGAQSFNFSVNGTAFLGKSGHGRIHFDGNQGFIYSASWLNSFDEDEEPFGTVIEPGTDGLESQYTVLNQGKDGLAIDLRTGHIDAYNFKLTSKNIYLNSSPDMEREENDYYFSIGNLGDEEGNEPSPGLLTFDREGNLKIQVNHLTLTGNLGGTNLLLNTAPKSYLGLTGETQEGTNPTTGETYETQKSGELWDFEPWTPTGIISIADEGSKKSVFTISANTGISQSIAEIKDGIEYMASVYVKPTSGQTITMATTNSSVSSTGTGWQYLTLLFTAVSGDIITFSSNSGSFKMWHPKVEEGTIATTWAESPQDAKTRESRLDAMFTQDGLWSKLSKNGTTQGVWLQNGELYINATHVAAGALFSTNWKTSGGTLADDGSITKYGTAGMAISLKTGEVHAAKFHLVAGTTGKLELNSEASGTAPYLKVGNSTNYLQFLGNGSFFIKATDFNLDATKESNIIRLKTNPGSEDYYFYIGNNDSYINLTADGDINIAASQFILSAGTTNTDGYIYLSNIALSDNIMLQIGKNFKVTKSGVIYATGATLTSLTVNKSLSIAKDSAAGSLEVEGFTKVAGTLEVYNQDKWVTGVDPVLKVGTLGTAIDGMGSGLQILADFVILKAAKRSYIGLDGTHICHMNGTLLAQGDFYYTGAIYCSSFSDKDKEKKRGVTGNLYYSSDGSFWKNTIKKAKFINGILVDTDLEEDEGETNGAELGLPGISGNANKFLQVNNKANAMQWTSLYAPTSLGSAGQVWGMVETENGNQGTSTLSAGWISIPDPVTATSTRYGTVKVHSVKTTSTAVTVNSASTIANKYYPVEMNSDGKLFVNVPWSNTTYSAGTGVSISGTTISCSVSGMPSCDSDDNQKCLMVVNGSPTWRHSGHAHTITLYYDADGIYTSQNTDNTRTKVTFTTSNNRVY